MSATKQKSIVNDLTAVRPSASIKRHQQSPSLQPRKHNRHHLFIHLFGSTLGRASLLLGAALGAFVGTVTLYFLSTNAGLAIDGSIILTATAIGILIGLIVDAIIAMLLMRK